LAPNEPPTNFDTTRTFATGRPKQAATIACSPRIHCEPSCSVSVPPCHAATTAVRSIGLRCSKGVT
jgi:hypothetical protein